MHPTNSPRDIANFNGNWRFHLGEEFPEEAWNHGNIGLIANETKFWQKADNHGLSKPGNPFVAKWRTVSVPHDFVLEGNFTQDASLDNGSLKGGVAWYCLSFHLPERDADRRIHIEFDGVYRDSMVFCNGHFIGRHLSGYTSFSFDLTEVCRFGEENVLAVRVDATHNELWSYEGGGIYRAVRLVTTAAVHVPAWGVHVRSSDADNPGHVACDASIHNASYSDVTGDVILRIVDFMGKDVARTTEPFVLAAKTDGTVALSAQVEAPRMWQLDDPVLYRVVIEIHVDGRIVDQYEQPFGFRYFKFDAATGFHLNGVPMKLKGLCCHQDHAGVGVAVPPSLQAWRVAHLKALGCNAIRTSHNPPDPALLDACDRLGMLVMNEIRSPGATGELLADAERLIRRDRNHPSVILWCLGNEEMGMQGTKTGINILKRLQHLVHTMDPDRLATYAMNCDWIDVCDIHEKNGFRLDVFGANYRCDQKSENYDRFHDRYPDWPLVGTETMGSGSTRGLYEPDQSELPVTIGKRWLDYPAGWTNGPITRPFASAYGNWSTWWGYSVEETWQDCVKRPFLAGTFLWTGYDYRGETAPYEWPAVITRFGVLDYCGFYKATAHYLRAWWKPESPHIFMMPHWSWDGHEGEVILVWCYANTASVELFLNGRSLGRRDMPVNGRLEWDVPYAPGELKAIGYDADSNEIFSTRRRSAGPPAAIQLSIEAAPYAVDGEHVIAVNAAIVDAQGEVCPRATNEVTFEVSGKCWIIGVGNGNPLSHEPDRGTNRRRAYHGLCQAIVNARDDVSALAIRATAIGLASGRL